ncbi:hypothetical protein EHS25_001928 [Saitozyma podzolica]|uniref:Uncharacterized protein n=1 Tax=Saitozyma podzolica TaxID=1890683 RepID=A0A427YFS0_9TREE|nr:hypothetical protein EHS25_001928 [Saitozyma podzolica]
MHFVSQSSLDLREGTSENAASAVGREAERSEPLSHVGQPPHWESNVDQMAAWLMNTDAKESSIGKVVQSVAIWVQLSSDPGLTGPTFPHCRYQTTRINTLRSAGP